MKHIDHGLTRRVLIFRIGSLGDTVIALPSLHLIQRTFPTANRVMLTNFPIQSNAPASAAVIGESGLVDGYMSYTVATRSLKELASLWWRVRKFKADLVIYLMPYRGDIAMKRDIWFLRLAGIKRIVGLPDKTTRFNKLESKTGLWESEAERLARNIAELGDPRLDDPASWDLRLTDAENARALDVLSPMADKPFFGASFGTKHQSNDWGDENWHSLLARIARKYQAHGLVIFGADVDRDKSEAALSKWRANSSNPALNICGLLTPRESAAVIKRADIFLGHDSGPMHLAASVNTACVAIFSARNLPGIWFPYGAKNQTLYRQVDCAGCQLETCIVQKRKCLSSISVDDVLAKVQNALSE